MLNLTAAQIGKKAVAYYRHSAEDKQENSVPLQREQVQKFATQNGIEIIFELADEGKTGLNANRKGFKELLSNWIQNPKAPKFDYILVLDESRWGRFQNPDEAAHYQFLAASNKKQVIYILSGFPNKQQGPISYLSTSFKRIQAGDFSRNLSRLVFNGCVEIAKQGYSVGGTSCYGLARLLLDEHKQPMGVLKKGQHKAISNARVIFTPANDETTEVVKRIFDSFVNQWHTLEHIARDLNSDGIPSPRNSIWKRESIVHILSNEVYIGTRIYNKRWGRLEKRTDEISGGLNPRHEWVIVPNAFPAIIDRDTFEAAQERLYWLIPSRWKRGTYAIRKARIRLANELSKLCAQKGVHSDDIYLALRQLPLAFGVAFSFQSSTPSWCFLIPDEMRRYQFVLGIGVTPNPSDPISHVFAVPTNEFSDGNYRIFSEQDADYEKYRVKDVEVEGKVMQILEEFKIFKSASSTAQPLQS